MRRPLSAGLLLAAALLAAEDAPRAGDLPAEWEEIWDRCWSEGLPLEEIEARFEKASVRGLAAADRAALDALVAEGRRKLRPYLERMGPERRGQTEAGLSDLLGRELPAPGPARKAVFERALRLVHPAAAFLEPWSRAHGVALAEAKEALAGRVDAFLAFDIARAAMERGLPRRRVDAFGDRWRAAARRGDVAQLREMACSSAVRFASDAQVAEWLERASLEAADLRRWILGRLECPDLRALAEEGSPDGLRKAAAHLDAVQDCPRCRGAEVALLRSCLARLGPLR